MLLWVTHRLRSARWGHTVPTHRVLWVNHLLYISRLRKGHVDLGGDFLLIHETSPSGSAEEQSFI